MSDDIIPQPTDTDQHGSTYALAYDATHHGRCSRCNTPVGTVCALIDDKDTCVSCVRLTDWWAEAQFIDVLKDLDATIASATPDQALMRVELALQVLFHIEEVRLPGGRDDLLPRRVVVQEIVRRRPADWDQEHLFRILKALVPDMTSADVQSLSDAAEERAARAIGQATGMSVALVLLRASGSGPGSEMTLIDAVNALDIDYQRFHDTALTAAAELGVDPADLPEAVVGDLVAGAKNERF